MNKALSTLIAVLCSLLCMSQTPTSCFEIESILVDACATSSGCSGAGDDACSCEGKNEMFRFKVGPVDLSTDDMDVDWANGSNPWQGVCQNGATEDVVAELNATILSCGYLVEPTDDILPSGSSVLMITSTDVCTGANSFAGLSDTLIVIFQCPGNYAGHFANFGTGGNTARTLEVNFGGGCEDEVTYYKDELIDTNGQPFAQDGAGVNFTWAGQPSYFNNGCEAPVEQEAFTAGSDITLCPDEIVQLAGEISDIFGTPTWSGGDGTFSDVEDLGATYTPAETDGAEIVLTLSANGCVGIATDEVVVYNVGTGVTGITTDGPTSICNGAEVTLTAEGDGLFQWSTNVFAPSITVDEPGVYSVDVDNACGTFTESIEITEGLQPLVAIDGEEMVEICEGQMATVSATATNGSIMWSTMETGTEVTTGTDGWIVASVTNTCGVALDSVLIDVTPIPTVSITPGGPISLCDEQSIELTAVGEGTFIWSIGESDISIMVDSPGIIEVTANNQCGQATDEIEIIDGGAAPVAAIAVDGPLSICPGDLVTLTGSGGDTYEWNGEPADPTLVVGVDGSYVLSAINDCGTDTETIVIEGSDVPALSVIGGDRFALCDGEAAEVAVVALGSLSWSDGGTGQVRFFTEPGSYTVTSAAECGSLTETIEVVVEFADAEISADPLEGEAPLLVTFTNESVQGSSPQWVFGDGENGIGSSITHEYGSNGLYNATLTVSSPLGCTDTENIMINVGACPFSLFVPSAFTPDADGLNDQLRFESNCVERFAMTIYDRWGNEVWSTQDTQGIWNAADANGYAVIDGEYPYIVTVLDRNGETHRVRGSVMVIR